MIDYEVKIFNKFHAAVSSYCNRIVSTPIQDYTKLPASCLYEMENRTVRNLQSSTPVENYAEITYQMEAVTTSKVKCREIIAAGDTAMIAMNFTRISGQYIPYPDNAKIVRFVARYQAVIDPHGNIYRD